MIKENYIKDWKWEIKVEKENYVAKAIVLNKIL